MTPGVDPRPAEFFVQAAAVLPIAGVPLSPGNVHVRDGKIIAVEAGLAPRDAQVIRGGPSSVLLPGLVSAHTHLALGHLSHLAQDRPFLDWILNGIVPALATSAADPSSFERGAEQSLDALIAGGVTAVGENFLRDEGATALRRRGQSGAYFHEIFGSTAPDLDAYWESLQPELDRLPTSRADFQVGYSPHTPWTCPREVFRRVVARARREGRRLSYHLAESPEEDAFFRRREGPLRDLLARRDYLDRYPSGISPVALVESLGGLGPDVAVAHAIHLDESDIERLARTRTSVVHCPTSNLRLAEGIAPVLPLLEAGVNVALGVDSAASTGRLDLFDEMRLALLLGRGRERRVGLLTAPTILAMATIHGARALGLEGQLGTLEPGKRADLLLLEFDPARFSSAPTTADLVIQDGGRDRVSEVWVAGVPVRGGHGR